MNYHNQRSRHKRKLSDEQLEHCLKRAQQRIDPTWTKDDIFSISKRIRELKDVILVRNQSHSYKFYALQYKERWIVCVYDNKASFIRTVLGEKSKTFRNEVLPVLEQMKRSGNVSGTE